MSTGSRRTKWHPTPPPSPMILRLPRRRRTHLRNQTKRTAHRHNDPLPLINPNDDLSHKGNLENLFFQENHDLSNSSHGRRERVEEREEEDCGRVAEEKWRFEAEMLRDECNLLRMERGLALKKLEKKRVKMETTLRSALQTLLSGRKKIEEGKNGNADLEEEIEDLAEKIDELQKNSKQKDSEIGKCSSFEKKAGLLQRGLEKLGVGEKELLQVADSCFSNAQKSRVSDEAMPKEEKCTGRCKAIVLRIIEQVRAETEQWSQMQKMLDTVRGEMEEMQASRDYWERQARNSDSQTQSLMLAAEEWKERALEYEKQVNELALKLSLVKQKKTRSSKHEMVADLPLGAQLVKERHELSFNFEENKKTTPEKELQAPLSLAKQLAKEKRSFIRSLKENKGIKQEDGRRIRIADSKSSGTKRSPLRNVANSSLLERQNHRLAFHYYDCAESSRIRESFRK